MASCNGPTYADLPPEIRQMIARFVFEDKPSKVRFDCLDLPLFSAWPGEQRGFSGQALRTCKLFYGDMLRYLYENTIFQVVLCHSFMIDPFLSRVAKDGMTHLELIVVDPFEDDYGLASILKCQVDSWLLALRRCTSLRWLRVPIVLEQYTHSTPVQLRHHVCIMRGIEHLELDRHFWVREGHWSYIARGKETATMLTDIGFDNDQVLEYEESIKTLVKGPRLSDEELMTALNEAHESDRSKNGHSTYMSMASALAAPKPKEPSQSTAGTESDGADGEAGVRLN